MRALEGSCEVWVVEPTVPANLYPARTVAPRNGRLSPHGTARNFRVFSFDQLRDPLPRWVALSLLAPAEIFHQRGRWWSPLRVGQTKATLLSNISARGEESRAAKFVFPSAPGRKQRLESDGRKKKLSHICKNKNPTEIFALWKFISRRLSLKFTRCRPWSTCSTD